MATIQTSRKLILLVDPDPHFRAVLRRPLEAAGFAVGEAFNGREGERTLNRVHVDAVIVDVMVESLDPTGPVAEKLRAVGSRTPVYVFTEAAVTVHQEVDFESMNIAGIFPKPFDAQAIIQTLKSRLKVVDR